jgi:hypothetical protein
MEEKKNYEKPKMDVVELKYRPAMLLEDSCGGGAPCPGEIPVGQ